MAIDSVSLFQPASPSLLWETFETLLYRKAARWNRICFSGFRRPPETSWNFSFSLFLFCFSLQTDPISHLIHSAHVPRRLLRHIWRRWPEAFSHGLWHSCLRFPIVQTIWYHWEKRFLGLGQWTNIVLLLLLLLLLLVSEGVLDKNLPGDWGDLAVGWASVK